ncbi:MAG: hypothetical protein MMC33_004253 [Icmadophila ericetorum]|nr:hypothetical protein [Icmadophila ericetorum]
MSMCGELQTLEKGWVGNGTGRQIGDPDIEEDATPRTDLKKNSPAQRKQEGALTSKDVSLRRFGGIEGIIRTFTGDGPEGMNGHGKHPNGTPYINCRAGGADEDRTGARGAGGARRGGSGAKASCMGCSVM